MSSSESEPVSHDVRLYDLRAIEIATALSSVLGGAFLISQNARALGEPDKARNILIAGVAGMIAVTLIVLSIVLPQGTGRWAALVIQAAQVVVVYLSASWVNGKEIKQHRASGATFHSRWRAAGVSLLLLPIAAGLFMVVALAFPSLPALRRATQSRSAIPVAIDTQDRKLVIVQGWNETELRTIIADFADMYRGQLTASFKPALTRIDDDRYRIQFPQGIKLETFTFLVNYINYPRHMDLTGRSIAVAGFATLGDESPKSLIGQSAVFYVPANDHDYDDVYIRVGALTYSDSFTDEVWKPATDPRMPTTVASLQ